MRFKVTRLALAGIGALGLSAALFASASGAATAASSVTYKNLTAKDFSLNFSAMAALKPLVSKGSGKVAAILPDTTSSTRYTEFDKPYLDEAFKDAGLPSSDVIVQNGQGSDSTFITDAQADITNGAKVLLIDPEDFATGIQVEKDAKAAGVKVVDYDRLTVGGTRPYYVSFNNVTVGKLLGTGLVSCVAAWKVKSPKVIVMRGAPTDNNATLFAQGYFDVLQPLFSKGTWTDIAQPAGTWTTTVAETEFQQAFTAHATANALLAPNDENAAPIITYLKTLKIKPYTFPVTGQDATLVGVQNIISGYQCGTVYKPVFLEAQAAAALAMYLRANVTPPKGLVNAQSVDPSTKVNVPSILLKPEWVTPTKVESTIVKDQFVPASLICTSAYKADCTKYKIH